MDTGSTFTAVPRDLLQRLGVPITRTAQAELADGSNAPVDIGATVIRLEGRQFHTQVIFAEEGEPSLLGVVTLEEALLAVDPVAQRLVPTNVLRYYWYANECLNQSQPSFPLSRESRRFRGKPPEFSNLFTHQ